LVHYGIGDRERAAHEFVRNPELLLDLANSMRRCAEKTLAGIAAEARAEAYAAAEANADATAGAEVYTTACVSVQAEAGF
jgi:hypothetical protein